MANTKISALPVASTLDGTEVIPIVKAGVTSKIPGSRIVEAIPPNTFAPYGEGIQIPKGWGDLSWKAARAAAGSRQVNVVGWGDSLTQGLGASNFRTTSWFGKLITDLQTLYGDGGSGFQSVMDSVLYTPTMNAGTVRVTFAGTWTTFNATYNGSSAYTTTAADTVTFPGVRGTTVTVYYVTTSGGGSIQVKVDGSVVGTINTNAPASVASTSYTVPAGTHTVVLTNVASTLIWVCGVKGTNATGIVGWYMGKGGRLSNSWATVLNGLASTETDGRFSMEYPHPDLFISAVGVNDAATGGATAVDLAYNTRKVMDYARAWNNGATDCVVVVPHVGVWEAADGGIYKWQDMASRLELTASTYGAASINFWLRGRASWDYWNSLGYWANASYSGGAGSDGVHPSDAGHAYMADSIKSILTAA